MRLSATPETTLGDWWSWVRIPPPRPYFPRDIGSTRVNVPRPGSIAGSNRAYTRGHQEAPRSVITEAPARRPCVEGTRDGQVYGQHPTPIGRRGQRLSDV